MKQNVGRIDRIVRVVAGLAIVAAGFYYRSWWGFLGLIPLATALVGWCPLYTVICPTCSTKRNEPNADH